MSIEIVQKFNELIKNQFMYGGTKYALTDKKESTDVLYDIYGKNWLFGTMHKYIFRNKNLKRERDILKRATYCYILWLKRGYFISNKGVDSPVIDTTVNIKEKWFEAFAKKSTELYSADINLLEKPTDILKVIGSILVSWSKKEWKLIDEEGIYMIYLYCFVEWKNSYSKIEKRDEDVGEKGK
jgi:hypothetical protein